MRALMLLLFILLAGPAAGQDAVSVTGCKDDQADCRDECTVEFGGSTRTYDKLGACLQKCKQKYDKCRERQFSVQKEEKTDPAPEATPAAPANADVSSGASTSEAPKATATPEPAKAPVSKESKPAAKASESKQPEPEPPEDMTELDQLFDELQTAPPPKPKAKAKAEPPATRPAADPKKDAAGAEPIEK